MYERFYGFRERPFDLTSNPQYFVLTESHAEALSNLTYAITSRKGVTLLLGEAGVGKTTVIRAAVAQAERTHWVHLTNPALTRPEFVEMLATQTGLGAHARSSKAAMLLEFEQLLRRRYQAHEKTALIIDEAQTLSSELLEEVRLLANIETDSDKLLSIIIAGQPEVADRLNDPAFCQLKQRIALRCELRALGFLETFEYVCSRIKSAGGIPIDVFTRDAVKLVYEQSRGNPRTINVIADNALLVGLATRQRPVTARVVAEVCRDFDITPGRALKFDLSSEQSSLPAGRAEDEGQPDPPSQAEAKTDSIESTATTSAPRFAFGWKGRRGVPRNS